MDKDCSLSDSEYGFLMLSSNVARSCFFLSKRNSVSFLLKGGMANHCCMREQYLLAVLHHQEDGVQILTDDDVKHIHDIPISEALQQADLAQRGDGQPVVLVLHAHLLQRDHDAAFAVSRSTCVRVVRTKAWEEQWRDFSRKASDRQEGPGKLGAVRTRPRRRCPRRRGSASQTHPQTGTCPGTRHDDQSH